MSLFGLIIQLYLILKLCNAITQKNNINLYVAGWGNHISSVSIIR